MTTDHYEYTARNQSDDPKVVNSFKLLYESARMSNPNPRKEKESGNHSGEDSRQLEVECPALSQVLSEEAI